MKSFSNTYIYIFSAVMVILVAALLSFVSLQLKPRQEENVRIEKMQNILASVRIPSTARNAAELYSKYITTSFVLNVSGDTLNNIAAFDVDLVAQVSKIEKIKQLKGLLTERKISPFKKFISSFIQSKELNTNDINSKVAAEESGRQLPVYVCAMEDGSEYYIFPLRGKGLWGPIWGYISLEKDMNTVYGAVFDHKSETPGLGADINKEWFQLNFRGKKIYTDNTFKSIEVAKVGTVEPSAYSVDGISGGTITSKGVQAMLHDCLEGYDTFIKSKIN